MGIPEMRKRGYPDGVAAGSIAAGGTLGHSDPPVRHHDRLRHRDRELALAACFLRA